MPPWENNPTMEDLILQFQQNITTTIHDLKMKVGQLADTMSQMQLAGFGIESETSRSRDQTGSQSRDQTGSRLLSAGTGQKYSIAIP
ncbi:hypothetical protein CR513_33662, partial [Mucuna pruriens]